MKTIVSKVRNLYKIKMTVGYILAILSICLCLNYYQDIYNSQTQNMATLFMVLIICFTIAGPLDYLKLTKIIVKQKEIEVYEFFKNKTIIKYSEIDRIERHKVIQQSDTGPITDGYFVSEVILLDGNSFILSPDKFENYIEIILSIKDNLNKSTFA